MNVIVNYWADCINIYLCNNISGGRVYEVKVDKPLTPSLLPKTSRYPQHSNTQIKLTFSFLRYHFFLAKLPLTTNSTPCRRRQYLIKQPIQQLHIIGSNT